MDGFRKCIEKEFTSIYVFNLRGGIRGKATDAARREGQNVFDIMTGVAITILVKNPRVKTDKATIYYHDIGEYLRRSEKLQILQQFEGINNSKIDWEILKPNEHGDWLNQRSDLFSSFIPIGDKTDISQTIFSIYSGGLLTSRDSWCYNFSKKHLENNIKTCIDFYNEQRKGYQIALQKNESLKVEDFIDTDPKKISWSYNIKNMLEKNKVMEYDDKSIVMSSYRPFTKGYVYFNRDWNERVYQQPKIFPTHIQNNVYINIANGKNNYPIISNLLADYHTNGDSQCFPLYYYQKVDSNIMTLFDYNRQDYIRRDGITDFILDLCKKTYVTNKITKEDIFYYIYGLLHSNDYRTQFSADLKKMLPRIPLVDIPNDFYKFSQAGKKLAELHLNYENVPPCKDVEIIGEESGNFHVEKLKFAKKDGKDDKTTIIYNSSIKITNIPLEAYDYVINGKSAIEWIMDRYQVKIDKDSGIKNDPNDWGLEHNNPRYILDLILSIITVSLETNKIVKNLPKLNLK